MTHLSNRLGCSISLAPLFELATGKLNADRTARRVGQDEPPTLVHSAKKTPTLHFANIGIKAAVANLLPAASRSKKPTADVSSDERRDRSAHADAPLIERSPMTAKLYMLVNLFVFKQR